MGASECCPQCQEIAQPTGSRIRHPLDGPSAHNSAQREARASTAVRSQAGAWERALERLGNGDQPEVPENRLKTAKDICRKSE